MAEEKKKDMSTEEFKEIAMRVLPHLLTLQQIAKEANRDWWITVDADGFINLRTGDSDWQLTRYTSGSTRIEHSYCEEIEIKEEEAS